LKTDPITVVGQGSFAFGGNVIADAAGRTLHVDHGYAQFQIPDRPRDLAIVMWHASSSATWESTFDGREGFQTEFLRRGFPVYVIDAPRQGRAGQAGTSVTVTPEIGRDQLTFALWRLGEWSPPAPPRFYPNVQTPDDVDAFLDQLFRARYPTLGPEEPDVEAAAVVPLLERTGPAILFTHSGSGKRGWLAAIKTPRARCVVAFEPVAFVFPEGARPDDVPTENEAARLRIAPIVVSDEDFERLAKIPIAIVFGDNIATEPNADLPRELWRVVVARALQFVATVNRYGGDATIIRLPEVGLRGNSHVPMQDANSARVAAVVMAFLEEHALANRGRG
jgi:Alpha/beta hydrolase family